MGKRLRETVRRKGIVNRYGSVKALGQRLLEHEVKLKGFSTPWILGN